VSVAAGALFQAWRRGTGPHLAPETDDPMCEARGNPPVGGAGRGLLPKWL